jgi:TRAP-type C4-dicarboxylate transport system permease small subunit
MLLNILKKLERHFEEVICAICLGLMASCIMLQVLLRILFDDAVPWAEEVAVYSMVFAVYLGASLGVRERAHIRVLVFVNLLPEQLKKVILIIADLVWFAFIVLMIVQSVTYMELLFETTFISPGLGVEQRWFQLVVPLSLVMVSLRLIQQYCCPPKDVKDEELLL